MTEVKPDSDSIEELDFEHTPGCYYYNAVNGKTVGVACSQAATWHGVRACGHDFYACTPHQETIICKAHHILCLRCPPHSCPPIVQWTKL